MSDARYVDTTPHATDSQQQLLYKIAVNGAGGLVEVPSSGDNSGSGGAGAQSEINLPAQNGESNVVDGVSWSYSEDPVGGRLTIENGSTIVFDIDITVGGPGFVPVVRKSDDGSPLVVKLYPGGAGVVGKLNVGSVRTE